MAESTPLPRTGIVFRKHLGENVEVLFGCLLLEGLVALTITIVGLHFIFKNGHATAFPPEDPHVGWVDNPENRGTLNIISACVSIIFTCVYISIHVDTPDPDRFTWSLENTLPAWMPKKIHRLHAKIFRFFTQPTLYKIYWLLFNIFAPELTVLVALCERWSANSGVAFMRSLGQEGWTMHLAFFADMGGFRLPDGTVFFTGKAFYDWYDSERPKLDYGDIEGEIRDRSKANVVLKLYTCAQALWLLVETVMRFAQHRPVSELEVATCSYVVCAIFIYGCWLHKPYGVDGRITLRYEPDGRQAKLPTEEVTGSPSLSTGDSRVAVIPASLQSIETVEQQPAARVYSTPGFPPPRQPTATSDASESELRTLIGDKENQVSKAPLYMAEYYPNARFTPFNRAFDNPRRAWLAACQISALAGAVIGAMHAVPFWNALFVNTEGQWLWRFCCIVQIAFPPLLTIVPIVDQFYDGIFLLIWISAMAITYCVSRSVLFVLIFVSFKSQPAGVYQDVDWAGGFIPHWH